MVNYKSATGQTVAIGRYYITLNPGLELASEDAELEALVAQGILIKNGVTAVGPKSGQDVPTPSGTSK